MTEFLLLGPVELRGPDGTAVELGPAKRRTVLAALLVDAGRWVSVETLVDRVWGEDMPARVRPSLYAHIARIRRSLADLPPAADGPRLRRGPGGYLLDVPPGQVDVHGFRHLVQRARSADCPDAERVELLRRALDRWRGEPLAGLAGVWVEHTRESWAQERIEAVLEWSAAEYRTGRHAGVIGTLTALAAEHPLVEPLTVALMRALQGAGRSPEALTRYAVLQKRLAEELGTDPGTEARQIHQAILRGEALPPPAYGTAPPAYGPSPSAPGTPPSAPGTSPPVYGAPPPTPGTSPTAPGAPPPGHSVAPPAYGPSPQAPGTPPSVPGASPPVYGTPSSAPRTSPTAPGAPPPGHGAVPPAYGPSPQAPGTPPSAPGTPLPVYGAPPPAPGTSPTAPGTPPPAPITPPPAPAQLPLEPRGFIGREKELARLDHILATASHRPASVVVSAVSGTAGIGKTALAVHWAHRVADRFPDGQLYVNLRGFDPSGVAVTPDQAVRDFLDALGGAAQHVPADPQAREGLYRSLLAGRRMLLVLDNARDADQVRPLLPGAPGCLAVITSRNRLTGLVAAEGAHPLPLDLLSPAEARALLGRRLGEERVAAEPDAAEEIIARCARLPLALAIVTARAAAHPGFPLRAVAEELRDSLDAFTGGDLATDVRAVFSWSHDALTPVQARLFALLGLAPGPDIGLFALACLAGLTGPATRTALQALENLHLVEQPEPGRWRMHDLVRLYAADRGRQDLEPGDRDAALRRLTGFYLHTVCGTLRLMPLDDVPPDLGAPEPGCLPQPLATRAQALEWLTRELPNLLAAQRLATERGWRRTVWQFAWSLDQFYGLMGHVHDRVAMWRAALAALGPDDAPYVRMRVHRRLGHAVNHAGAHDEALRHLDHALDLADDPADQVRIHIALAQTYGRQNRLREALRHSYRALRNLREEDLPALKAAALNSAGWYEARAAHYAPARAHCESALPLARGAGHDSIEADILDSLGYIAHHTGRHEEAVAHYRLALARYRGSGSDHWVADTLERLGRTYAALGRTGEARGVWEEAAAMYGEQHRGEPAERVRRRLGELGSWAAGRAPGSG
ncbi:BTAD domain-containing putative transcriptional regulator [Streptomyces acidiscabies]|uniref:BTAD domain-containing putative transcriptional regulator n=1 Tax=Streptomyces acidiscabies TaxID=42234 RepID=UPI00028821D8|nr:BTAD domain-containing putative transcriptional regulator [Streptomyces acidiscabies]